MTGVVFARHVACDVADFERALEGDELLEAATLASRTFCMVTPDGLAETVVQRLISSGEIKLHKAREILATLRAEGAC